MESSELYDFEKVLNSLGEAAKNLSDISIEPLCVALYEWTILFKLLGKTLSMAFSDITEKVQIMRNHLKNYGSKINGIMSLVQLEISLDVHRLNGENNKSLTKNKDYFKYEAGARVFFNTFIGFLLNSSHENCAEIDVVHGLCDVYDGGADQGPEDFIGKML